MNDLLKNLSEKLYPFMSIVLYENKGTMSRYYLEAHEINEQGQVLEGKPLQQETIQQVVDVFYDNRIDSQILSGAVPDNLLSYTPMSGGNYSLTWYRPAELRVLHFAKQLKIPTAKSWVPPVLYRVAGRSLSVYVMKSNARPNEKTKLYRAPFHNVGDEGAVCLGSAKVKKPVQNSFAAAMKYWEDLFWLSEFTHLNGASNPTKKPVEEIWRKLIASKEKLKWADFSDELKQSKKTIKALVQ